MCFPKATRRARKPKFNRVAVLLDKVKEITLQEGACFARLNEGKNEEERVPVWVPENTGYLIEKEDTEALDELTSYLHYLIKVDQLFGLEAGPKSYVFAKGNTPPRRRYPVTPLSRTLPC